MSEAIDFIGDIHGHCDELRSLLLRLGYVESGGAFRYPDNRRKVVFLGDYVDRGPKIRETLHLVRAMCEAGSAVALMGNHEFNMLSYWHRNGIGGRRLRKSGGESVVWLTGTTTNSSLGPMTNLTNMRIPCFVPLSCC